MHECVYGLGLCCRGNSLPASKHIHACMNVNSFPAKGPASANFKTRHEAMHDTVSSIRSIMGKCWYSRQATSPGNRLVPWITDTIQSRPISETMFCSGSSFSSHIEQHKRQHSRPPAHLGHQYSPLSHQSDQRAGPTRIIFPHLPEIGSYLKHKHSVRADPVLIHGFHLEEDHLPSISKKVWW